MLRLSPGRYVVIPTFFLVLLTVCHFRSATCLGSDRVSDSNSTEVTVDGDSGVAPVEKSPPDQSEDNGTQPGDEADSAQDTSSDDTNTTSGNNLGRQPFWLTNKMIAFYVVIGTVAIALTGWFFLRNTGRTRLRVRQTMSLDKDLAAHGGEFLVVFDWTQKVLYLPTVIASLFAAIFMYILDADKMHEIIGGIWFAIFFLNFLVEEYNIRLMVIITSLVSAGFLLLLLILFQKVHFFFRLFTHLDVVICWKVYLLVGLLGLLTIVISWLRGLFYYVVITPNYINIQEGLTETGKQIARRDFHTSVDTTDLVERLLGFGKIKITFKGGERPPITLYVWRIGTKVKKLEEIGTKMIVT